MGKRVIDQLEAGMVVGADVQDRNGRFLLGAGTELTQKHLMVFRTWGIAEVDIVGADEGDSAPSLPSEVTEEALIEAEQALSPLFRLSNVDHPVMALLFRLAALRKAGHAPF